MTHKQAMIIEMVSGLIGFSLFWYATSWVAALGLFVCLFANNVGHSKNAL